VSRKSIPARIARYLAGWPLLAVGAGFLIAVVAGYAAVGSFGRAFIWMVVATVALLVPLLVINARSALRADDRHQQLSERIARIGRVLGDGSGSLSDIGARVAKLDEVVADSVRRPTDPTTLPWSEPVGPSRPVLLLPSASYHLAEIMPLADSLHRRGIETRVAVGEAHWPRIATGLAWYETPVYSLPEPSRVVADVAAVVTMKDWAGYGEVVAAARAAGIPTFAKVEGAQDFADTDTPYARDAYRSADHILCQGQIDFDALVGSRHIVGSSRLERIRQAPVLPIESDFVVINLNFTYGVLEEERALWIDSAVEACVSLRVPYAVALHPAERRTTRVPRATAVPISRLLVRASALVSRFSTVPFEAMARGVPFVYHNPHGEKVATFADGGSAFRTTTSAGVGQI